MIHTANGNGSKSRITGTKASGKNGNGNGRGNGHKGTNGKANGNGSGSNGNGHHGTGNGNPVRLSAAEVELKVQQFEKHKAAAKEQYEAADRIEQELIESIGVGGSVTLGDNRTARVVNNFVDASGAPKVKHFGLAGVKMFDLKIK